LPGLFTRMVLALRANGVPHTWQRKASVFAAVRLCSVHLFWPRFSGANLSPHWRQAVPSVAFESRGRPAAPRSCETLWCVMPRAVAMLLSEWPSLYIVSTLCALAPRWRCPGCLLRPLRPSSHAAISSGLTSRWYPSRVYEGRAPRSMRLRMASADTPNLRDAWAIVRRVVSSVVFSAVSVIGIIFHCGLKRGLRASLTAHGVLLHCCATVY
jgi:hypothetical protein